MSVLTQLLTRNHPQARNHKVVRENLQVENSSREKIFCAANFLLFLVLGPFAAIPALISMISLISGDEVKEPRMIGE
jgi:hypothetical protein